jgi:hypothetical protein
LQELGMGLGHKFDDDVIKALKGQEAAREKG